MAFICINVPGRLPCFQCPGHCFALKVRVKNTQLQASWLHASSPMHFGQAKSFSSPISIPSISNVKPGCVLFGQELAAVYNIGWHAGHNSAMLHLGIWAKTSSKRKAPSKGLLRNPWVPSSALKCSTTATTKNHNLEVHARTSFTCNA